jgi:hydroxymethylpyrimidine/phosphomethylpyrimidine kinase
MREKLGADRPVALLVGGTDPSGGAGLAADLKSVAALGCHGCLAVTAVTVQNSSGVRGWTGIDPKVFCGQVEAVCDDCSPAAVKSGMLGSAEIAAGLADLLERRLSDSRYVLDPVLVAGSGDPLHGRGLEELVLRRLLPRADLVTPNLDEAEALTGLSVRSRGEMERAARSLLASGAGAVLLKGGHLSGRPADYLLTGSVGRWFPGRRVYPGKVHGTGCTLGSALTAHLALGYGMEEAVSSSLSYLRSTIRGGVMLEGGPVPGHLPPAGPMPAGRDAAGFYMPPLFCSRCGAALRKAGEGHPVCPDCGMVAWRNPLPAVSVVARRGGRILLVRRAVAPARGMLCLPGGFMELGETVFECGRRELAEETSLSAERMRLAGSEVDDTAYGGVVLTVLEAEGLTGTPQPGDDASEVVWAGLDDVGSLAFAAHDRIVGRLRGD